MCEALCLRAEIKEKIPALQEFTVVWRELQNSAVRAGREVNSVALS